MTTPQRSLYRLGNEVFKTKDAIADYVRNILHSTRPEQPISGTAGLVIRDLLQLHPSAQEKIGSGIAAIIVRTDRRFKSRHFHILRIDGTDVDFSYRQCLQPSTARADVTLAFRAAIADQVAIFKAQFFANYGALAGSLCCPLSYEPLTMAGSHVDHKPPKTFARLLAQFLEEHNLDVATIPTFPAPFGEGNILAPDLATTFNRWHRAHADLRVISSYANLNLVCPDDDESHK